MYNRNYGGLDFVRVHSQLLTLVINPKFSVYLSVTDGYTKPLWCIRQMKIKEPKFRCGTEKAIKELVAEYDYPYAEWMQDWSYEIAESKEIENYFQHYDEQTDDDKKFSLMEMLIQALTDIENDTEFNKNWNLLKERITKDFKIHEYTVFYWSCFGKKLSDCWKVTPYMRELWKEIKNG